MPLQARKRNQGVVFPFIPEDAPFAAGSEAVGALGEVPLPGPRFVKRLWKKSCNTSCCDLPSPVALGGTEPSPALDGAELLALTPSEGGDREATGGIAAVRVSRRGTTPPVARNNLEETSSPSKSFMTFSTLGNVSPELPIGPTTPAPAT